MRPVQILAAMVAGTMLLGVAVSQSISQSTSQSRTGSNTASASASSSSHAFGSQSASAGQRANGSGSGSSMRLPNPTHAIMFTQTQRWSQEAYNQVKQSRVGYFTKLQQMGKLLYFGPWRDQAGEMSIVVATDDEVRQIAQEDPAVTAGLLTANVQAWTIQVEPYTPAMISMGR
ncbi:MAG TPA: YciI family protein [Fimbriimonadaceae bacterium]|nr:YciI family protein [Fimbriimonadaceae bacterium]